MHPHFGTIIKIILWRRLWNIFVMKYNQSADTAIKKIKEKRYQGALSGYNDKILLVGVNYDAEGKDRKKHTCVIEEWKK